MGKNYFLRCTAFFVLMIAVFSSCKSEMDEYYELPGWLKGNAWESLEKDGNYTIFLKGIEKSGLADMVKGKGIITVMAPTDQAFEKYLKSKGMSSLDDMSTQDLKALINYHLLYYSFTKPQFISYNPYGAESSLIEGEEGIYYKYRTRSSDGTSTIAHPADGRTIKIYHKERFLPVLSYKLFKTLNIDAKANYEYFYPNSTWTGASDGFNVSNASVTEYAQATDNGYIYKVSDVLEPLETIYNELKKESEFTDFVSQYDRFLTPKYDAALTELYGASTTDSMWIIYHTGLPKIGAEWTYNGAVDDANLGIPDYAYTPLLMGMSNNIFAPNNTALQSFMSSYWGSEYSSLNDVNVLIIRYLLGNHSTAEGYTLIFPQAVEGGLVKSLYGNTIQFSRDDASIKKMCVNGLLYGLNKVIVPPAFESVTAPLFKYKRFNNALYLTNADASLMSTLTANAADYTFFVPNDDMFTDFSVNGYPVRYYPGTNPLLYGTGQAFQVEGDSDWGNISGGIASMIMKAHVHIKDMTPNRTNAQGKVFKNLNTYGYNLVRNDSIYTDFNVNSNSMSGAPVKSSSPLYTANNGVTYELEGSESTALLPEFTTASLTTKIFSTECPSAFLEFKKLLLKAGLNDTKPIIDFLLGNRYVVFIPNNNSVIAGLADGTIPVVPDDDKNPTFAAKRAELVTYLKRYFMDRASSFPLDYAFFGSGESRTISMTTYDRANFNSPYLKLDLIDDGTSLKIKDFTGSNIAINESFSFFPRMYFDGAAYLIDGLIKK